MHTPALIQRLESRRLLAVNLAVVDGVVVIDADNADNDLLVAFTNDERGDRLVVSDAGVVAADIARPTSPAYRINALGGDDTVNFSPNFDTAPTVSGGAGNDTITGVGVNLRLDGDAGDDRLISQATGGSNTLNGGDDDDTLFGSLAREYFDGGDGFNVLDLGDRPDIPSVALFDPFGPEGDTMASPEIAENAAGTFRFTFGDAGDTDVNVYIDDARTLQIRSGTRGALDGRRTTLRYAADTNCIDLFQRTDFEDQFILSRSLNDFDRINADLGDGVDVFTADSIDKPITVLGNGGDDVLQLTTRTSTGLLDGGAGDDSLSSTVYATGQLTVLGGAGDDGLSGDVPNDPAGRSTLDGGVGNDTLRGGAGSFVSGGAGDDELFGGGSTSLLSAERSTLRGGAGDDTLTATGLAELHGEAGNDTLFGNINQLRRNQDQVVSLFGGDGADTLVLDSMTKVYAEGNDGNDFFRKGFDSFSRSETTLLGGAGDDTYLDVARSNDDFSGGPGIDTIGYRPRGNSGSVVTFDNIANDGASDQDNIRDDVEVARFAEPPASTGFITVEDRILYVTGTEFNDSISLANAASAPDTHIAINYNGFGSFHRVADFDRIEIAGRGGNNGANVFWRERTIDVPISSSGGSLRVRTEVGLPRVTSVNARGSDERDVFTIDAQSVTIIAGGGSDEVGVEADHATIDLGDGDDRLGGIFGRFVGNATINGGAGNDDIRSSFENLVADGGAGNDYILGGNGDDSLLGGPGDDTLSGATGNDTLHGNDGDDRLVGGKKNDQLSGGNGNDRLYGDDPGSDIGAGNYTLIGNRGRDLMNGGSGADTAFIDDEDEASLITNVETLR